jgi:hypothetical protein
MLAYLVSLVAYTALDFSATTHSDARLRTAVRQGASLHENTLLRL